MWFFTTFGFFSVVAHRDKPETLIVRSRVRLHLERLLHRAKAHSTMFDALVIAETPGADYRFRIELKSRTVALTLYRLVLGIDYPNFKGAVAVERNGSPLDDSYLDSLHDVWSVMLRLQTGRARPTPDDELEPALERSLGMEPRDSKPRPARPVVLRKTKRDMALERRGKVKAKAKPSAKAAKRKPGR